MATLPNQLELEVDLEKKHPSSALVRHTPADFLRTAIERNVNPDLLVKFQDMYERWEANEARKQFVEAMSAFKAHAIQVVKDKTNPQYGSKYVSLGNLVASVTPFLSQHGLSCSWEIDQTAGIKVSCKIRHIAGHSESVSMIVPPDDSGKKNPIQQIKSAITYAKACTFESICGLASTDANLEDDGNQASNGELAEKLEWIANAKDPAELMKLFKQAYEQFEDNPNAIKAIVAAKNKRKGELS